MAFQLFLLGLPILLVFLLQKHRKNAKKLLPPGPPGLPIIGNLHQLGNLAPHIYLTQLSKKYGSLMFLRLGSVPTLVVSSPKMAKEVMKTHDLAFCSRPPLLGQQKFSYNFLDVTFSPYNDYWREMRKICVVHLFNLKKVQSFRPIREEEVYRMISKISQLSHSSKLINLNEIVMALTSNIICRVGFGKRSYEDEGCERSKFHEMFIEAQVVMIGFYISNHFPRMGWIDKLSGMYSRLEKSFKEMDLFFEEIIEEHLNPTRDISMQKDILDTLLQLKKDQLCPFDLTLDNIKALLMNILFGGTETNKSTVVSVMTELIKNPRVMVKVQEEVRSLIGNKGRVDENDLHKLQYLNAVIKETMRLNPPLPFLISRETIKSCIIDGYKIPPKTLVYVNAWAIGRDLEFWDNPEEFYPERFIGSDIDFKGNDFELIPFGAGRRGCPGINLGIVTVELILANFLFSFDWELPTGMNKKDVESDAMSSTGQNRNPICLLAYEAQTRA